MNWFFSFLSQFKFVRFVTQRKIVEIAVAVIMGYTFNQLVQAIVTSFITPFLGILGGVQSFRNISFSIHSSVFPIGYFIEAMLSFFFVLLATYYCIVSPATYLSSRIHADGGKATRDCPQCFSEMHHAARRCPMCTSKVEPLVEEEVAFAVSPHSSLGD